MDPDTHSRIRRMRIDANAVDGEGRTLLVIAVQAGQEEVVEELLKMKADVNRKVSNGKNTALIEAVKHVTDELTALAIVKRLIDANANVNYANEFDQTALFACAPRAHLNLVKFLVNHGASINHVCKTFKRSLLYVLYVVYVVVTSSIEFLITCGARLIKGESQRVLLIAASLQSEHILSLILRRIGAGPKELEAQDEFGDSPLHIVCGAKDPSIAAAHLLVEAEIDMEKLNSKGLTPILKSLSCNVEPTMAVFLLESKANPNHASPSNSSPLIFACRFLKSPKIVVLATRDDSNEDGVMEAAQSLIRGGANVKIRDADNRLPLHVAHETAARLGMPIHSSPFIALLLSHAGHSEVFARDGLGLLAREVYEEVKGEELPLTTVRIPTAVGNLYAGDEGATTTRASFRSYHGGWGAAEKAPGGQEGGGRREEVSPQAYLESLQETVVLRKKNQRQAKEEEEALRLTDIKGQVLPPADLAGDLVTSLRRPGQRNVSRQTR
ncbi:hypothetical protein GUITHDRAFT_106632 [Guillardia theta CCMP2712]|uniref:Uncharacterized protein n=1 Tax=Guillardia theta (strain CCMP2712) TaxID=905079 RepID=L1JHL9_GUITC|nr:hypothetical protein GUITHDRAFT_106632 [Guillardia theta CCMP2712]EKX47644.1 hypothetical protein GUITHDRAFT_106632 [Guillardia theta CCMP2712]|eukprot:XP_005834624.1 hypothetical protein GUITHDRAFT_106632 [Guillardia theta CCMP2712]